jgi:hypothetical protein
MRALHLIAVAESLRGFAEGLFAPGTLNFDSVSHTPPSSSIVTAFENALSRLRAALFDAAAYKDQA